jgi:hypothetical protein
MTGCTYMIYAYRTAYNENTFRKHLYTFNLKITT